MFPWLLSGVDFGKAYDIPGHMRSEWFYAAVVLKVRLYSWV